MPFFSIFLFCWPPPSQQNRNLSNWSSCLPHPSWVHPFLPPPPSHAGRESWFYLFFCLFGKRAVAVLGPGCCVLPRAAGRPAVLASQECGRDAPRYIYSPPAAGPSRAKPGLPGGPGGSLIFTLPSLADPTWPLGPLFPPFSVTSADLLGLSWPASRNTRSRCQYNHKVGALGPDSCGPIPGGAPPPHPGA